MSPRAERFIQEYPIDLNGKQAAIRAGFSEKTAEQQASRLLRNVKVKAEIVKVQQAIAKRNELSVDWVIQRLKEEAENHGDDATSGSRIRATELIGQHFGMFKQGIDIHLGPTFKVYLGMDPREICNPQMISLPAPMNVSQSEDLISPSEPAES